MNTTLADTLETMLAEARCDIEKQPTENEAQHREHHWCGRFEQAMHDDVLTPDEYGAAIKTVARYAFDFRTALWARNRMQRRAA